MFSKSDFSDHVKFWTYDSGMSPAIYASNVPDPQYMEAIGQQDYTKGRAPLETLPAQWWNWLLNGETDRFNNLWSYTTYLIDEINNLLDLVGIAPTTGNTDLTQLKTMFNQAYFNFFSDFMLRASGGAESWAETTGHTYAVAIADYDGSTTYKTTKASALPVLVGGTGANNAQDGLENLCANVPAALSSASTDEVLFKDGTDVKKVSLTNMAPEIYDLIKASIQADNLYTRFQMPLMSSQAITTAKTVEFPAAYDPYTNADQRNLIFKAVFTNGHNALGPDPTLTPFTLSDGSASPNAHLQNLPIVSYQNGTLNYLPIHTMDDNGNTVYRVVAPNTCLELYYNPDWDGNGNAAWVVVGNPLVLSGADYSIYANGQNPYALSGIETITLSTIAASPTEIQYDGELIVSCPYQGYTNLTINGITFTVYYSATIGGGAYTRYLTLPLSKGDLISYTEGGSGTSTFYARWYKERY